MSKASDLSVFDLRRIAEAKHAYDRARKAIGESTSPMILIDSVRSFQQLAKAANASISYVKGVGRHSRGCHVFSFDGLMFRHPTSEGGKNAL